MSKKRYPLIDSLRALALLSMIIYHTLWDLNYLFGVNIAWFNSVATHIWQQSICWTFIIISGFCVPLSSKVFWRGINIIVCSFAITAVSTLVTPQNPIFFGVLGLIGSGMVLSSLLDKLFRHIKPTVGVVLFAGLFLVTRFFGEKIFPPEWNLNMFTACLGFPPADFSSADYFPLVPWLFLYFAGYFLCLLFKEKNYMKYLRRPRIKPLEFIGRNSLLIYMLHQPIIYGIMHLFFAYGK